MLVGSPDSLILSTFSCAYLTACSMDNKLVTYSSCHENYLARSSNAKGATLDIIIYIIAKSPIKPEGGAIKNGLLKPARL
jgi:hypothetical protein